MKQPVLAVLMLASVVTAQRAPAGAVARMPQPAARAAVSASSPMLSQMRQKAANQDAQERRSVPAAGPAGIMAVPAPQVIDPATVGPQLAGKDLKKAIKKVTALQWHEKLSDAKAESAATGKPILWVQALGELDGFA
jgi:hypothetical protein